MSLKILWIPHAGWHIPQRAHLFCRVLSERHEIHVTDWVADFSSAGDYLSRRYLRNFTYRISHDRKITVHGIPRISPALFVPALRMINTGIFSHWVQRIINRYRIDAVVGTFVTPPPRAPRLVFDLFDDNVKLWRSSGGPQRYADEIAAVEQAYLQSADAVVAAGSVLAERVRARTHRPVHTIANGVDLSAFLNRTGRRLREAWKNPGMVIGDIGNHDVPGELHKILDAAKILSGMGLTFIIAGRGKAVPDAIRRVRKERISGVLFFSSVPPADAPDYIQAFDVGLCPYLHIPGSDERSPMRLLMYAAGGLPTVCTDLEEVRRMNFSNVVLVKDNPQALADGVSRARTMSRGRPDQIESYDIQLLADRYEKVILGREPVPTGEDT